MKHFIAFEGKLFRPICSISKTMQEFALEESCLGRGVSDAKLSKDIYIYII